MTFEIGRCSVLPYDTVSANGPGDEGVVARQNQLRTNRDAEGALEQEFRSEAFLVFRSEIDVEVIGAPIAPGARSGRPLR